VKLGVDEPKKVAVAAGLLCVAAYAMYSSFAGEEEYPSRPVPPSVSAAASKAPSATVPALDIPRTSAIAVQGGTPKTASRTGRRASANVGEWVPAVKPKRDADRPDPATVDPALRTDLLARLQSVTVTGGHRSLFEFGAAAPKPVDDVKIDVKKGGRSKGGVVEPDKPEASETKPAEPAAKPVTPIPLKYYGYVRGSGHLGFFVKGEEIFTAAVGELVDRRYRVVRLADLSVEMEDIHEKNKQTLPIEQPPASQP